jgi:molecular chaperone GrpE
MTDSVSNIEDLEPIEGDEAVADDATEATDYSDLLDPLEGLQESHEGDASDEAAAGSDGLPGTAEAAAPGKSDSLTAQPPEQEPSLDGTESVDAAESGEADGETELVLLQSEFHNLNDRHLRLAAEFNNFRRRTEQQRLETWTRAQADLVGKFLDVLDDLHRVADLDLSNATVDAIMEGIDLVERKFQRVVEDSGMEMIDPVGEAFDPERMEAMMRVPTEDEEQDDVVAQVFQKGYSLKGILVRPARVSVHKHG